MKTRLLATAFALSLALLFSPSLLQAQTISFKPVTKFSYPGANSTGAYGINDAGDVVGAYVLPGADYANGFVRHADGTFESIVYPGSTVYQTFATAINNQGVIAGWFNTDDGSVVTHGFFLSNGVYTSFDYPTAAITNIYGINDAGDFVGNYTMPVGAPYHGFASIGGQLSEVTVPGTTYVEPHDINNRGDIVGWANTVTGSYGFRLQSKGTRYPITPSRNTFTSFLGTNDTKASVGTEGGGLPVALYYGGGKNFVVYNFPGLTFNNFTGINHRGLICGYGYDDAAGILYSYLVRLVTTESTQ